ncbi:glutamine amidotransferase [Kribbella sp. NPDC051587]|uniref:glutamine amidotransferase n=1 Tax=Kribbella sp. NPDC051587 TaxID=3364119 RepID=UPI003794D8EB
MPLAIAVRHVFFEDLGLVLPILHNRGYSVRYLDPAVEGVDRDAIEEADLVVVLGGPIGANDAESYPFLADEIDALVARLGAGRPTLGICLGAQLIARALGANVAPGTAAEIGYAELTISSDHLLEPLRGTPVLHWHYDCFDLPRGARNLASTEVCPHQAFALGAHVLALQFHLEVDHRALEHWLVGYADVLVAVNADPRALRRQARTYGPALAELAGQVIETWLDQT